jgi:thiol-disulfide isomerase/thioredoxin
MLLESVSLRIAIVTLLGLGAALGGCARSNGEANQAAANQAAAPAGPVTGELDRSHAGMQAPSTVFQNARGEPTSLEAYRGRPLLVNFWATWCGPCVIEMPSLDALAVREGEALQVLALSQDLDGRDKVTQFFAERNFRALEANLDPQLAFMSELRIGTLPTTILYDAEGREVWRIRGRADWESERVARLLAEAEAG